ncbi:hypothetical protein ILUMI_09869 [Ignelater luminosus]|uniref:Uncharacterized protein n=1 Tax=Ignelater luminosus TaxID=2038154 RepID=A0A8K0D336_IGNLU|nr:hypothetical protein ILUMI_09869 [Ignelater luminosus]
MLKLAVVVVAGALLCINCVNSQRTVAYLYSERHYQGNTQNILDPKVTRICHQVDSVLRGVKSVKIAVPGTCIKLYSSRNCVNPSLPVNRDMPEVPKEWYIRSVGAC